jgi:hypothetical protein
MRLSDFLKRHLCHPFCFGEAELALMTPEVNPDIPEKLCRPLFNESAARNYRKQSADRIPTNLQTRKTILSCQVD